MFSIKTKRLITRLSITILLLFTACSSNSNETDEIEYTKCYKFIERGSNIPIKDLSILIHSSTPSEVDRIDQGLTDAEGEFCFTHTGLLGAITMFRILGAGDIQREGNGYLVPGGPVPFKIDVPIPIPPVIELDPVSYLKFHVQNVAPIDDADEVLINYSFRDNSNWSIWIQGKIIDTIFITHTRAGSNKIKWNTRLDGVDKYQESATIFSKKNDTLYFEILY